MVSIALRERASGTVALSVAETTVTEGHPDDAGTKTATWTVTATTARDEAPEPDLVFHVGLLTAGDTATSPEDYELVNQTVRFDGTDTWTRTEIDGDHRYVATKTGTVNILDDVLVEGDETLTLRLVEDPRNDQFIIDGDQATITIEDADTFGLAATVSPDVVMGEASTDVTVTLTIVDAEGVPQGERECIVSYALDGVSATVGGTATDDDFSYTGALTGLALDACEASTEAVLEVTVPQGATTGREVVFTPALGAANDQLDTELVKAAILRIEGTVPGQVTGVEVEPGNGQLQVSWTPVQSATGYLLEWKSGTEDYATERRLAVSGGTTESATVTGLANDTEHTVRVRAVNDEGEGASSEEVTATPNDGTALATLTLSAGALSPPFEPGTTAYETEVSVSTLTIVATPLDADATVTLGRGFTDADTTQEGFQLALELGANVIRIVVDPVDSGTAERTYTIRATRVAAPTISIERSHMMIPLAWTDPDGTIDFTLTRTGDPSEALDVTVELEQAREWLAASRLSQAATFAAGSATTTVSLTRRWFWADNSAALPSGRLTATLADVTGYDVEDARAQVYLHGRGAVTGKVRLTEESYRFEEATAEHTVTIEVRLERGVYPAGLEPLEIRIEAVDDEAEGGVDFVALDSLETIVVEDFDWERQRWIARKALTLEAIDDALFEPDETLELQLHVGSDYPIAAFPLCLGDTCVTDDTVIAYPAIIEASDTPTGPTAELERRYLLETDDPDTSDDEQTATVTYAFTGGGAPSRSATLTLTLSGSATEGTDYTVSPADEDTGDRRAPGDVARRGRVGRDHADGRQRLDGGRVGADRDRRRARRARGDVRLPRPEPSRLREPGRRCVPGICRRRLRAAAELHSRRRDAPQRHPRRLGRAPGPWHLGAASCGRDAHHRLLARGVGRRGQQLVRRRGEHRPRRSGGDGPQRHLPPPAGGRGHHAQIPRFRPQHPGCEPRVHIRSGDRHRPERCDGRLRPGPGDLVRRRNVRARRGRSHLRGDAPREPRHALQGPVLDRGRCLPSGEGRRAGRSDRHREPLLHPQPLRPGRIRRAHAAHRGRDLRLRRRRTRHDEPLLLVELARVRRRRERPHGDRGPGGRHHRARSP